MLTCVLFAELLSNVFRIFSRNSTSHFNVGCCETECTMTPKAREDFVGEDVLQAVILAETFNTKFEPVTQETPFVSAAVT